jgi:hypothetical protein
MIGSPSTPSFNSQILPAVDGAFLDLAHHTGRRTPDSDIKPHPADEACATVTSQVTVGSSA